MKDFCASGYWVTGTGIVGSVTSAWILKTGNVNGAISVSWNEANTAEEHHTTSTVKIYDSDWTDRILK